MRRPRRERWWTGSVHFRFSTIGFGKVHWIQKIFIQFKKCLEIKCYSSNSKNCSSNSKFAHQIQKNFIKTSIILHENKNISPKLKICSFYEILNLFEFENIFQNCEHLFWIHEYFNKKIMRTHFLLVFWNLEPFLIHEYFLKFKTFSKSWTFLKKKKEKK